MKLQFQWLKYEKEVIENFVLAQKRLNLKLNYSNSNFFAKMKCICLSFQLNTGIHK